MDLETIIQELKIVESNLVSIKPSIECYLFGSILTNPQLANDIDVLILYEDNRLLDIVKHEFNLLSTYYPIHLSCFTFSEQRELNFVKGQKALKIFSL
ncbi:hypothetical protein HGH91_26945 [Chitinophaga eiseniae]|uniref:Polymerase nucleotidyl transferase domain-containing protein n=2 Tax=Chitinophaga eiseniae TaxID=634771 RepID=A0A847SQH6_9BACT|nr:hypothetical protein [Chitinophaga eiseniae]